MSFDYHYLPRIKEKSFLPNPVARHGIPAFADSQTNRKVIGRQDWKEWWYEQFDRCRNGYTTGGLWIPGRLYWYINFCKITTAGRGYHLPDYTDFDQYFFETVEEVKANHEGIILLKRRRGGASERLYKGVMGHGVYFSPEKYQAGIAAGLQDYVDDARMKFRELNANLPPEMRLRFQLSDASDRVTAGWWDDTKEMRGSFNSVFARTMFKNPNVMKGKFLNDCGFEEAGEFEMLDKGYSATEDCFKVGDDNVGTVFIQGTVGKLGKSMQSFLDMYDDAPAYKLRRMFQPGYRLFLGTFVGSRKGAESKLAEDTPNLDAIQEKYNLRRDQLLGCEDVARADDIILNTRRLLSTAKNREKYWEHFLSYPRDENEARLKFQNNNFDNDCLNNQRIFLTTQAVPLYGEYFIDYVKDAEGALLMPLEVHLRPIKDTDDSREAIYVRHGFENRPKGFKNALTCGIDGYDQDKSNTSKSLGAIVITLRKGHSHKGLNGLTAQHKRIPIVLYRNRPKRKEVFYDIALKLAVHYELDMGCLCDAANPGVIDWFKNHGGRKYLAPRPQSFEDIKTTQAHDFGMKLTQDRKSKPQMISCLQSWVLDEIDECVFPQIIEGLTNYDIEQTDSDWDEVDAFGLSLVRDIDWKTKPRDMEKEEQKYLAEKEWKWVNGQFVLVTVASKQEQERLKGLPRDPFMEMLRNGSLLGQ